MQVTLTGTSTSNFIYTNVDNLTKAQAVATGIYNLPLYGGTNGSLKIRFLHNTTVLKTQTFTLTTESTDYASTYTGGSTVTRIDLQIVSTNTGSQQLVVFFEGQLTIYSPELVPIYNNLFWRGYVDASRLSRRFVMDRYFIDLSATDGLLDLKEIDYTSISGFALQSTILRTALNELDLQLDLKSQLNISSIAGTGNTLQNTLANTKRFKKTESNGKVSYWNCQDVITHTLRPYNARLFQANGCFQITQLSEFTSPRYTTKYNNGNVIGTGNTRIIDVNERKLLADSDELSKISPLKSFFITYRNKSLPDNVVTNGTFNTNSLGWTAPAYPNNFYTISALDGQLRLVSVPPPLLSNPNVSHWIDSPTFSLTYGAGATVTVEADITLANVSWSANTSTRSNPYMKVQLLRKGGGVTVGNDTYYMNTGTTHYVKKFQISSTASDYFIRFEQQPYGGGVTYQVIDIRIDNVTAYIKYDEDIVFDKFYEATNSTGTSVNTLESEIFFGDASNLSDVGVLKKSASELMGNWSNYLESQGLQLQGLYAYNTLRQNSRFKNYLKLSFLYPYIHFNNILYIKNKYYYPVSLVHDLGRGHISVELIEVIKQPLLAMASNTTTLNTADGD